MFRSCKTREERFQMVRRLRDLFKDQPDLLELLEESFDRANKQYLEDIKRGINRKFPGKYQKVRDDRMDEHDDRFNELMEDMRRYQVNHLEFQRSSCSDFISSVSECMFKNGSISGKQYNILIDIYYKNNMEIAREEFVF
jgi:hypothetical protein